MKRNKKLSKNAINKATAAARVRHVRHRAKQRFGQKWNEADVRNLDAMIRNGWYQLKQQSGDRWRLLLTYKGNKMTVIACKDCRKAVTIWRPKKGEFICEKV